MVSLNSVSRQVGGAPQEVYSRPIVARRLRLLHRVDWLHLCKYFVNVCRFRFPFFFFFTLPFPRPPDEWRGDSPSSAWCSPDRRARSDLQLFPARPVIFFQSPPPSHLLPALRLDPSEPAHFGRIDTGPCGAVYNGVSYWSCRVWNLLEVLLFCRLELFRSSSARNFTPLFPFLLSQVVSSPRWASRSRLSQAIARWLMMGCLSIGNWWVTQCQWPWIPTRLQSPVATAAVYYDEKKGLQKHHWENKISVCVEFFWRFRNQFSVSCTVVQWFKIVNKDVQETKKMFFHCIKKKPQSPCS